MLEGYRKECHARFANGLGVWTDVYITTIKTPEQTYAKMIDSSEIDEDPISQLLSRITDITYCYKVNRETGEKLDRDNKACEFYRFTISGAEYRKLPKEKLHELKELAKIDYLNNYYQKGDKCEIFNIE
jgi:hypothetical protein